MKHRIGILIFKGPRSKNDLAANAQGLSDAIIALGHEPILLHEPLMTTSSDGTILHNNEPLPDCDVILARPDYIEEPSLRSFMIESLVEAGHRVINAGPGIAIAKNKLAQHMLFRKHGLATPTWCIASRPEQAIEAASLVGFPVVVKVPFGTHGKGVFFAKDPESFRPLTEYLAIRDKNPLIIERFVSEADRKDVRVLVIDGNVVAAMERQAPVGDIRANTSNGGVGHQTILSREEVYLATRATEVCELEIAGVDIIRSADGPQIIEINANPGFEELDRVSEIDVPKAMIAYTISQIPTS